MFSALLKEDDLEYSDAAVDADAGVAPNGPTPPPMSPSDRCRLCTQRAVFGCVTVTLASLFVVVLLYALPMKDSERYPVLLMVTSDRIQFRSNANNLFVRVHEGKSALVLDQAIPWKRGSTFEVETSGECFLLRSMTGKYIRVDGDGVVKVDADVRFSASHFAAILPTLNGKDVGDPVTNCTLVGQVAPENRKRPPVRRRAQPSSLPISLFTARQHSLYACGNTAEERVRTLAKVHLKVRMCPLPRLEKRRVDTSPRPTCPPWCVCPGRCAGRTCGCRRRRQWVTWRTRRCCTRRSLRRPPRPRPAVRLAATTTGMTGMTGRTGGTMMRTTTAAGRRRPRARCVGLPGSSSCVPRVPHLQARQPSAHMDVEQVRWPAWKPLVLSGPGAPTPPPPLLYDQPLPQAQGAGRRPTPTDAAAAAPAAADGGDAINGDTSNASGDEQALGPAAAAGSGTGDGSGSDSGSDSSGSRGGGGRRLLKSRDNERGSGFFDKKGSGGAAETTVYELVTVTVPEAAPGTRLMRWLVRWLAWVWQGRTAAPQGDAVYVDGRTPAAWAARPRRLRRLAGNRSSSSNSSTSSSGSGSGSSSGSSSGSGSSNSSPNDDDDAAAAADANVADRLAVSAFHIVADEKIRGVNLGGWFIPEVRPI